MLPTINMENVPFIKCPLCHPTPAPSIFGNVLHWRLLTANGQIQISHAQERGKLLYRLQNFPWDKVDMLTSYSILLGCRVWNAIRVCLVYVVNNPQKSTREFVAECWFLKRPLIENLETVRGSSALFNFLALLLPWDAQQCYDRCPQEQMRDLANFL